MSIRIEARKNTDQGGYLAMPLRKNVPHPRNPEWELTECQECGRGCWKMPLPAGFTRDMFSGELCTECALRKGARR